MRKLHRCSQLHEYDFTYATIERSWLRTEPIRRRFPQTASLFAQLSCRSSFLVRTALFWNYLPNCCFPAQYTFWILPGGELTGTLEWSHVNKFLQYLYDAIVLNFLVWKMFWKNYLKIFLCFFNDFLERSLQNQSCPSYSFITRVLYVVIGWCLKILQSTSFD